jgi:Tat protein secretion system quality control protein TatD with DNase activity
VTDAHCHVSGGDPSVRELLIGRDFVGVHPWATLEEARNGRSVHQTFDQSEPIRANPWLKGIVGELREKLAADPRLGVGEIGLDRLKEKTISPEMRELFAAQLALAFEFRRPVILHGAKCWGEVVKQITVNSEQRTDSITENTEQRTDSITENTEQRTFQNGSSWVPPDQNASATTSVHCSLFSVHPLCSLFTKNGACPQLDFAKSGVSLLFHGFSRSDGLIPDIVRLNGYISVGPAVLNDHAVNYRELVKKIPLDRLLVETDRDCPCEELINPLTKQPLMVRDVLEKTAEIRGLSPAELEAITDENARRFLI